jgi:hypothetical protein
LSAAWPWAVPKFATSMKITMVAVKTASMPMILRRASVLNMANWRGRK